MNEVEDEEKVARVSLCIHRRHQTLNHSRCGMGYDVRRREDALEDGEGVVAGRLQLRRHVQRVADLKRKLADGFD